MDKGTGSGNLSPFAARPPRGLGLPGSLPPPVLCCWEAELSQLFRTRNRFLSSLWKAENLFNKYYVKANIIQKEEVIWLVIK